jgi:hypothetical protein
MQSQSTQNPAAVLGRIGIFVMLPIGLLLLAGALYDFSSTSTWLKRAVEVQGTVIRMLHVTDKDGDVLFKPVVRFSTADGKIVEFQSSISSRPAAYSVGQSVPVVYLPDEPGRAAIRGFLSLWMGSLVLGFIGAIFFGIGAAMVFASRRVSRELAQPAAAA